MKSLIDLTFSQRANQQHVLAFDWAQRAGKMFEQKTACGEVHV